MSTIRSAIKVPKRDRPLCGATTRRGTSFMCRSPYANGRCVNHGGRSTGPKTAAGRARIAAAQRERHARQRERFRGAAAAVAVVGATDRRDALLRRVKSQISGPQGQAD